MDKNLAALKPALVWKYFAEIVRIPRPSHHEEKIRKYILDFARAQGLECKEDSAHNVYVSKPASKGMENRKGVILSAHLDMVPQKNNDKEIRFHERRHRRLCRRRLGDGRRHDAGRRQRYRRGGDPRGAGGQDAGARAAVARSRLPRRPAWTAPTG